MNAPGLEAPSTPLACHQIGSNASLGKPRRGLYATAMLLARDTGMGNRGRLVVRVLSAHHAMTQPWPDPTAQTRRVTHAPVRVAHLARLRAWRTWRGRMTRVASPSNSINLIPYQVTSISHQRCWLQALAGS